MNKLLLAIVAPLILWSAVSVASPLMKQWAGTGIHADKFFCEYGDGEVKMIYGNQNCPLSN